jgi:hypothetical protein
MLRLVFAALILVPCLILLAPVFAVAAVLLAFAALVRFIAPKLEPPFVSWKELIDFDRELGWKPKPNLDTHCLPHQDDVFRVMTDAEGWPGHRTLDESAIAVIGDSFAFGYGIDPERSFANLNEDLAIKNIGAPGYSMVQPVMLMETLADRLAGKLVVWFVCLENDLEDNFSPAMGRYRCPFVRPTRDGSGWEIAKDHVTPAPWQCSEYGRKRLLPFLCVDGPLADRAYAAADYLIGRAAACCRSVDAQLVLVTIPDPILLTTAGEQRLAAITGKSNCDPSVPDRRLGESCRQKGVRFLAGRDYVSDSDYKRRERLHWNEQGHRRMAKVLASLYESFSSKSTGAGLVPRQVAGDALPAVREIVAGSR